LFFLGGAKLFSAQGAFLLASYNYEKEYKNGKTVIDKDTCSEFDRINKKGFEIFYNLEKDNNNPDVKELSLLVFSSSKVVGGGQFIDNVLETFGQNIWVDEKYRRKGICTAMYVFAEKILSKKLSPMPELNQSDSAKALWNQSRRPFGNK